MFFSIKQIYKNPTIIIGESKIQKPISQHAEVGGLKKLQDIYVKKHKIYTYDLLVFRVFHNNTLHYSRPCYHCIKNMEKALFIKIRNVYYTAQEGEIKCETFKQLTDSANNGTAKISSGYRLRMFGEDRENRIQNYNDLITMKQQKKYDKPLRNTNYTKKRKKSNL